MADEDTPPPRPVSHIDVGGVPVSAGVEDSELGVSYQRAGQVRQNLAELRIAKGHGNVERIKAARKGLEALGFNVEKWEQEHSEAAAGGESVDARRQPPEGRSATPPSQIRTGEPHPEAAKPAPQRSGSTTAQIPEPGTPSSKPSPPASSPSSSTPSSSGGGTGSGTGTSKRS